MHVLNKIAVIYMKFLFLNREIQDTGIVKQKL